MPRKSIPARPDCPYHVTARSNNRNWFELPLEEVWSVFENQLFFIHHAFQIQIHSFVLMSNHFHLLVTAPLNNLPLALRWFMTETSREIAFKTNRINHVYGQRNYKCLIDSYHYYMHAYKYVYRNPVEAGLCDTVEAYPFSTFNRMLGINPLRFPIVPDLLFEDFERNLKWLNTSVQKEHWDAVRSALRKSQFSLRKNPANKKEHPLQYQLL